MSEILVKVPILDHGYVALVETWGSEQRIVEAARMSNDKGFLGWGGDEPCPKCLAGGLLSTEDGLYLTYQHAFTGKDCKHCKGSGKKVGDEALLRYLWTHHHGTPFEMAGLIIEVQAPIFVFREWHRHRTQSYNELSARYTPLPDVNYMPTVERCLMVNAANKQSNAIKGADELTHEAALDWLEGTAQIYEMVEAHYQKGLNIGLPKEVARIVVPVGRYSRMRASANLRNWLAFCTLRHEDFAPDAQWEIRQFGKEVGNVIKTAFPRVWDIYTSTH